MNASSTPRRVLVLYWSDASDNAPAGVKHHLRALDYATVRHHVRYYNAVHGAPAWLRHFDFDAVILHESFLGLRWSHRFPSWKGKSRWIRDLDCLKIAMPRDEYDHSEILDEWLFELGTSVILSNFDAAKRAVLYPIMSGLARFHQIFSGYIDDSTARRWESRLLATKDRKNDIVYRPVGPSYWFDSQGRLKRRIGDVVARAARELGLVCDISARLEDTMVGDQWMELLASGKTVIGCESGSSVLDRRGEIAARIRKLMRDRPAVTLEEFSRALPDGWDGYEFFVLGPQHFEAVITRTCQVLTEGSYGGVLEPWLHYVPLRRDLSNVAEVLGQVRDSQLLTEMTDRAYEEIYRSGKYTCGRLARIIEEILFEESPRPRLGRALYAGARLRTEELMGRVLVSVLGPGGVALLELLRSLSVGTAVRAVVGLRVTLRHPPLRRLLRRYLSRRDLWRVVRPNCALAELLRLGLATEAQQRVTHHAPAFVVTPEFDAHRGALELQSRPLDEAPFDGSNANRPNDDWTALHAALRARVVHTIVWNHSRIATELAHPVSRSQTIAISLGPDGRYPLPALVALAKSSPDEAAAALALVLRRVARPVSPRVRGCELA